MPSSGPTKYSNRDLAPIGHHQLAKLDHRFLASASTGFSSVPIGAIVARTRSPGRGRCIAEPTPRACPWRDVAWLERDELREERDDGGHREDHAVVASCDLAVTVS
jgi:hypothetical protein